MKTQGSFFGFHFRHVLAILPFFLGACASRSMNENYRTSSNLSSETAAEPTKEFLGQCGSRMTLAQYNELLDLSNLDTFTDFHMAAERSRRIAEIFAQAGPDPAAGRGDRRGIFASMYVEITKESVGSSERGEYQDNVMASRLVKRFAERYFGPLHDYLSGRKGIPEWETYYRLAGECDSSDLRILGTGVNIHMSYDLANSLKEIGAPVTFEADFMKLGQILIQKKRQSTNLLMSQQNVYAAAFFDLFLAGKAIDTFFKKGTAAVWGFQLIRAEAWLNGQLLQNKVIEPAAHAGIRAAWLSRQGVLALMPHSNSKMKGTEE